MKRIGQIFPAITTPDNIKHAILNASIGKRNHRGVKKILNNIDFYSNEISEMLTNKTFTPKPYRKATIVDGAAGKVREIYKPAFYPDQIIHWALMLQIGPIYSKRMHNYSCGSLKNKGTTFGQKAVKKWIKQDQKNTKYCFKMDASKYYPSVDNEILKSIFRKKLKCKDTLWLIDTIVDSNKGLPIGNYTSQWFANIYLSDFDFKISKLSGVKHYIRYIDDVVIFGPNKRALHKARKQIEDELTSLKLCLKDNWQLFKTPSRPVDFLGVRFYKTHTTLRRRNALRIKRRIKRIKRKTPTLKQAQAAISYWGWIKRTNSYNYYTKNVKPYVSINACRKVASAHAKTNSAPRSPSI